MYLKGKRGLVFGIANQASIAFGCAKAMVDQGAEVIVTYGTAKAESFVTPLLPALNHATALLCDVTRDEHLDAVFSLVKARWGTLDFMIHSIAFAPMEDLHGRVVDCSKAGFLTAMDISCHSFIRLAKLSEPLMTGGGCLQTISYYGSQRVVQNYNIMGPVKAALECITQYMAAELGPKGIRVHALSPGPLQTRAASGIKDFDVLMAKAVEKAPLQRLVTIEDVGATAAFLASDAARGLTGNIVYIDAGYHSVD
ncbi:MAG: enoyl-ACP reductase FabI [Magnetococcales bacterium]|nr:enoyl-ACP reductase FabI [Magnetococcales bacterium]